MATTTPSPTDGPVQPASQQQDLQIPVVDNDNETNSTKKPLLVHQTVPQLPQPQPEQPPTMAHQTRSGRVICNTPRFEQSITK